MSDLVLDMQKWLARTSVGASTVRGQRTPGLVKNLRHQLGDVSLDAFATCKPYRFAELLDMTTENVRRGMPRGCRHWGVARKVVNIFLRSVAYNFLLREQYKLQRLEPFMEVPLDKLSVTGIEEWYDGDDLPRWRGVSKVTPDDSAAYQAAATVIARQRNIDRVHLDMIFWGGRTHRTE